MMNNPKINPGMRISTRREGKGTVVMTNGGYGWVVKFDNEKNTSLVMDWDIFSEDGNKHNEEW